MPDISDIELLRDYDRSGSEGAFAELVRRHINLVYSAALRQVGMAAQAEEITQAVFVILARKAGSLRPNTILEGWLYETTRLTSLSFMRGERRRQFREQEAYMQSTLQESTDDLLWQQLTPMLDEAMSQLGGKDRDAVILRFFKDKSVREVAAALNVNEGAAQRRVHRAVEKLRNFFMKRGVSSTAGIIAGTISSHSVQVAPAALAKSVTAMAIVKGAAASASTLTLIQGALKLMAWTKAKITIAAGVAVLLAAGTTVVAVNAVKAARTKAALATMQGSWEGVITVDKVALRLVFKIFRTNGTYAAALDSIDQGAKGVPITTLSARKDSIHAEMPALGAVYQAALNADGTEISGTWKQLNRSWPLKLKRMTDADQIVEPLATDDYAPRADSALQGAWEGTLKAGNAALRLNLRIAEPTAGTFRAELDSVDQGAKNLPVTSLTYDKPTVRFEMAVIKGTFEGSLNGQDDEMEGTWTQMGKKMPLTFRRAQTNAEATADAEKDYGQKRDNQVQGHWIGTLSVKQGLIAPGVSYRSDAGWLLLRDHG